MKTFTTLIACLLSGAAFLHAGTQETPDEITITGDFTQDSLPDLMIIDRASGQVRVGEGDIAGQFTWLEPRDSGVEDVSAAVFGNFGGDSFSELVLTSRTVNRGIVLNHAESWTSSVSLSGAGHSMLVDLPTIGLPGTAGRVLTGSVTNPPPQFIFGPPSGPNKVEVDNLSGTFAFAPPLNYSPAWQPVHGTRLVNNFSGYKPVLWREVNPADPAQSLLRLVSITQGEFSQSLGELDTATLNGTNADYVVENVSDADYWVFTWRRGSTDFTYQPLTMDFSGPIPNVGFYAHPNPKVTFGTALTVDFVNLITRGAQPPLVAVSEDNGSVVKLYSFDGTALTLEQNVFPQNGQRAAGLVPWGNAAGFALLTRAGITGPSTKVTRYATDGNGQYQPLGTDSLAGLAKLASANVFLWQGEPMVNPAVKLVSLRRASDWTSTVTHAGSVVATAENFASTSAGLGNPQTKSVGTAPFDVTHSSGNQAASNMSVFAFDKPLDPVAGVQAPLITPAAGRYTGPTVLATVKPRGFSGFTRYRVNGGTWARIFNDGGSGVTLSLTTTTILEAYGEGFGTFGATVKTPIVTVLYTLGASPTSPTRGVDGDGNGLIDEWEKLFGITDPTGDRDSDGQSNFAEFNAGTDPLSASSFHTPPPTLPPLRIGVVPTGPGTFCICANWSATDPSVRLEYSQTLGPSATWLPVPPADLSTDNLQRLFTTVPTPGERARFFRLARY